MEIFNDLLRSINEQLGYGIFNYGYYANPEIDMIADDIKFEMNNEKRVALMQEGFGIVMDDVACIPLISVKQTYLMKNSMEWSPRADKDIKINDIKLS